MPPCFNPYFTVTNYPAPCGKCQGCRTSQKQLKTHRIMLEASSHEHNCFVTLTYNEENFPADASLSPDDLKKYFYRLRQAISPTRFRYFAVGEYGTSGARGINPHYHLCLFGIGPEYEREICAAWTVPKGSKRGQPIGFVHIGELTPQSAAYVAGYVQKKNTYNEQMYEDLGIHPEFCRASNRPYGIGGNAVKILADVLLAHPECFTPAGDVPISLKHGNRILPLGKYLREKLREELKMDCTVQEFMDVVTGELTIRKKWHAKELQKKIYEAELSALQKNQENPDPKLPPDAAVSRKRLLAYLNHQPILNFKSKQNLKQKEKTL